MRPQTGGRIELELLTVAGTVTYRATLQLPDAEHAGEAVVDAAGNVAFGPWTPPDPPAWLVEAGRQFLRAEWRSRRGPDPAPWPQRITRWRAG